MSRSIARSVVLSILLALLVPALASAHPAGRLPDAHALKRAGLKVTWPLSRSSSTVAPGAQLTVTVRRLRAEAPVAHVDLVRMTSSGLARNIVSSRHLRSGRATVTIPKAGLFTLRLRAGRLTYNSWVEPRTPPAPAPAPTPAPPAPTPLSGCPATGAPTATLSLDAGFVATGGSIGYTLANTGPTCLMTGVGGSWERKDGDQWTPVPSTMATPTIGIIVKPGASYHGTAQVEPSMTIGRYRLVVGYYPEPLTAPATSGPVATAEVDVVPAGGNDVAPPPAFTP